MVYMRRGPTTIVRLWDAQLTPEYQWDDKHEAWVQVVATCETPEMCDALWSELMKAKKSLDDALIYGHTKGTTP